MSRTELTSLTLGLKATFDYQQYQLVAVVTYRMTEEGTDYYWDEFILVAADESELYLEFDQTSKRWYLARPFEPQNVEGKPVNQLTPWMSITIDGVSARVTEAGQATIVGVQGKLPSAHAVGKYASSFATGTYVHYVDAAPFAIEIKDTSVEFFRVSELKERQVYQAFNLQLNLQTLEKKLAWGRQLQYLGSMCVGMGFLAWLLWILGSPGQLISSKSLKVEVIPPAGLRYGPFMLNPNTPVHQLKISGSMNQASAWVAGILETENGQEAMGIQADFWQESGTDSDGYWSEAALESETYFVVQRPGPYFVRLYAEKDPSPGTYNYIKYELRGGVVHGQWFMVYILGSFGLAVVLFCLVPGEVWRNG